MLKQTVHTLVGNGLKVSLLARAGNFSDTFVLRDCCNIIHRRQVL
jgi:hypothetical protein